MYGKNSLPVSSTEHQMELKICMRLEKFPSNPLLGSCTYEPEGGTKNLKTYAAFSEMLGLLDIFFYIFIYYRFRFFTPSSPWTKISIIVYRKSDKTVNFNLNEQTLIFCSCLKIINILKRKNILRRIEPLYSSHPL